MTTRISGILTPHMVPLDEHGAINEAELRRYVDWLITRGVDGLYPNGSTGEFIRFTAGGGPPDRPGVCRAGGARGGGPGEFIRCTAEERRRIIRIVCEQAAGRVPVLAGAAEANVRETLAACEAYAGFGARAVAIVSPFYYRLSPESVDAYFSEIPRHSPIDITLYNFPLFAC